MVDHFSTISLGSYTKHIFDHDNNRVLCGLNRWNNTPFRINETRFGPDTMLERHLAFAERRGYPNPFKYTCKRCAQILNMSITKEKLMT